MQINKKKTVVMPFNFSNNYDFIPRLNFPGDDQQLSVTYETKLLGVTIRSDLSFSSHVANIVKSAKKCMWPLLRFRDMGATTNQLLNLWIQKGRTVLEFASPVFFSRLTEEQSNQIEKCQKMAFAIILQNGFKNYADALTILKQRSLSERRLDAAIKFGEKCLANPRHSDLFIKNTSMREELRRKNWKPIKEYFC